MRFIPEYPLNKNSIDLSTNSYLSLHSNEALNSEASKLANGILHGNIASRLIHESSPIAIQLEKELAQWKKTQSALLFNSGYAANIGVLSALCTRSTELFCDRLNHASIIDGAKLAGCKLTRYRHNDMSDLRNRLAASSANEKIIVTDTVFSMDGDCAFLADICTLAETVNAIVMVDEAHATGIFGPSASGLVEEYGVADKVAIRIGTLSKAIAGLGGFFAGDSLIRDYLVNSARSFIYSTALPHSVLAFDLTSVRHIRANPSAGRTLLSRAEEFRVALQSEGFDTLHSTTHIVPILMGSSEKAVACSAFLRDNNIIAPAIRPPTVPANTARIRFSVHSGFNIEQQQHVLEALGEWKRLNG